MACANVANLLLVRTDARSQELAIRTALGARSTRLARLLLAESLTLALIGGVLGVAVAYGAVRLLVRLGPVNLPRLAEVSIDAATLAFGLVVSLVTGVMFGIAPIMKYALAPVPIMSVGRSITSSRQRSQFALVALQVALSLVLLVSAALMIRTFQALNHVDPGFAQPERVLTFSISIPPTEVAEAEQVTRQQQEMLQSIGAHSRRCVRCLHVAVANGYHWPNEHGDRSGGTDRRHSTNQSADPARFTWPVSRAWAPDYWRGATSIGRISSSGARWRC